MSPWSSSAFVFPPIHRPVLIGQSLRASRSLVQGSDNIPFIVVEPKNKTTERWGVMDTLTGIISRPSGRRTRVIVGLIAFLGCGAGAAFGQSTFGSVLGTVQDPS